MMKLNDLKEIVQLKTRIVQLRMILFGKDVKILWLRFAIWVVGGSVTRGNGGGMMSEKIRIVFDGPPGPVSGRFIEVENEHGEGMSLGGWKEDGEFWYLEFDDTRPKLASARAIMLKFVGKVDCGMAKSVETYSEMKAWLEE